MALLPNGPQINVQYTLTGPDGTRAVFNNPFDSESVGSLVDVSGLDSAEVRESADDLVEADGGVHGEFFYGRRPVVLEGLIHGQVTAAQRNLMIARLQQASNAMRDDATLEWTPDGGTAQFLKVRRQVPLRVQGGWNKTFQLGLVAADPRIYSSQLFQITLDAPVNDDVNDGVSFDWAFDLDFGQIEAPGQVFLENSGNAETWPVYDFIGPGTGPYVWNLTSDKRVQLIQTLAADEGLRIDTLNRTVFKGSVLATNPDVLDDTTLVNRYSAVDFLGTDWHGLLPGVNNVRLGWIDFDPGARTTVYYRYAWL